MDINKKLQELSQRKLKINLKPKDIDLLYATTNINIDFVYLFFKEEDFQDLLNRLNAAMRGEDGEYEIDGLGVAIMNLMVNCTINKDFRDRLSESAGENVLLDCKIQLKEYLDKFMK